MQIRRTATPNNPPTGLVQGQLAVGMADTPPSLWVGVPTTIDPTARRLINPPFSASSPGLVPAPGSPPAGSVLTPTGWGLVLPQLRMSFQGFDTVGTATYTPPAGLQWAIVEAIGSGGGGGWVGPSMIGGGGGGGCGGYSRRILSAAQIGANQTVTIGPGGTSAVNGGAVSFGSLVTANGGLAGSPFDNSSQYGRPGAGGASVNAGYFNLPGTPGTYPGGQGFAGGTIIWGGNGGSMWGGGAIGAAAGGGIAAAGAPGVASGGGGSGAATNNGGTAQNGGTGASGIVLVTEFSF
jgi:hypothetical protein